MSNSVNGSAVNFLNDAGIRFPNAISFAAGQPCKIQLRQFDEFAFGNAFDFLPQHARLPSEFKLSDLLQYGPTAGWIPSIIQQHLLVDQQMNSLRRVRLITAGCQEAITLSLLALCREPRDVILVNNPTYLGFLEAARAIRIRVRALPPGFPSDMVSRLLYAANQARLDGQTPQAFYITPTFENPTGEELILSERRTLIEECAKANIIILEDDPYGRFRFAGEPIPTLSSLDEHGVVFQLTSFSKTVAPGLRLGAISTPDRLFGESSRSEEVTSRLIQIKASTSLNTSSLGQAILAQVLIAEQFSLKNWILPSLQWYSNNSKSIQSSLEHLLQTEDPRVRWNQPKGGFFLTLELPFDFLEKDALYLAEEYGVLVTPMRMFSLDDSQNRKIRLAFSNIAATAIEEGIHRLARYIKTRLNG